MAINEIISKVTELQELKRMQEELQQEIDSITDMIKNAMDNTEILVAGPYKLTYKTVTSSRIDTTALKKELPEIASRYNKVTSYKRLTIN